MRLSSIFPFVAGLIVAGGSAISANAYLEAKFARRNATQEAPLVDVIVASQDIAFGQSIESHLLTTIAWPRDAVPSNTFSDYNVLLAKSGEPTRRARRAISQGELVLVSKVSEFGE